MLPQLSSMNCISQKAMCAFFTSSTSGPLGPSTCTTQVIFCIFGQLRSDISKMAHDCLQTKCPLLYQVRNCILNMDDQTKPWGRSLTQQNKGINSWQKKNTMGRWQVCKTVQDTVPTCFMNSCNVTSADKQEVHKTMPVWQYMLL